MYKMKSKRTKADPCGTPKLTLSSSDELLLRPFCEIRFKSVISYSAYSIMAELCNKISGSTVSNAFLRSIKIPHANLFSIPAIRFIMAWEVEKLFLEPSCLRFYIQLRVSLICYCINVSNILSVLVNMGPFY